MIKRWMRVACLALIFLFLPGCALASPQRWLEPVLQMRNRPDAPARGRITLHLDGDAWTDLLFGARLASLSLGVTMMGATSEELEEYLSRQQKQLESLSVGLRTELKALEALLNALSFSWRSDGQSASQIQVLLNQEPVCAFTQYFREDQTVLTTSDLFPAYALQDTRGALSPEETADDPEADDLLRPSQALAYTMQNLIDVLPAYMDFHFLSYALTGAQRDMAILAAQGLAEDQENASVFEGTLQSFWDAREAFGLPYVPFYSLLNTRSLAPLREMDVLVPDRLMQQLLSEEPTLRVQVSDREALWEMRMQRQFSRYEIKETATGSKLRTSVQHTVEAQFSFRCTQDAAEVLLIPDDQTKVLITADASAPDEILFQYHLLFTPLNGEEETVTVDEEIRLQRTEEGQRLILTPHFTLQNIQFPVDIRIDYRNDLTKADLQVRFLGGEAPASLLDCHWEMEYGVDDVPAFPGTEGLTVVSDPQDAGFRKELQTVAKPYLNRLLFTRLPQEARPLLAALLSLVGQLGN